MAHQWIENDLHKKVVYKWEINNQRQSIRVKTAPKGKNILPNTEAEFITEHYYGYTKHKQHTFEYEVTHPSWKQYPVLEYHIKIDFTLTYGHEFEFLNSTKPRSVILAKGSEISVLRKRKLYFKSKKSAFKMKKNHLNCKQVLNQIKVSTAYFKYYYFL